MNQSKNTVRNEELAIRQLCDGTRWSVTRVRYSVRAQERPMVMGLSGEKILEHPGQRRQQYRCEFTLRSDTAQEQILRGPWVVGKAESTVATGELVQAFLMGGGPDESERGAAVQIADESILDEAIRIIGGDREEDYGPAQESLNRIATLWGAVLGAPVTPQQVCLCMIQLKISRECHRHKRDNLVDMAGYASLMDLLQKYD